MVVKYNELIGVGECLCKHSNCFVVYEHMGPGTFSGAQYSVNKKTKRIAGFESSGISLDACIEDLDRKARKIMKTRRVSVQ